MITTLELMHSQIKRCYDITHRLRTLGKSQAQAESCAVNDVIEDILDLLDQQFSASRIKISKRLGKQLPLVGLSRIDGHQVIHNLLTNAIAAMPGGGNIRIRTFLDKTSKLMAIEVIDDGVGITSKHLPKVFEPFFTTKEQGIEKSSGLGLSIVYAIIQEAGGSIHIQSSLRKGTQVNILLPLR